MKRSEARNVVVETRALGVPDHGAVVGVAARDDSVLGAVHSHRAQRRHGVGNVLEHLVGVDHVERTGLDVHGEEVRGEERGGRVRPRPRVLTCRGDGLLGEIHADHLPGGAHDFRQVQGDRAGAAPQVENPHPGTQPVEEIGAAVRCRPGAVGGEDRRLVAVAVARGCSRAGRGGHEGTVRRGQSSGKDRITW